MLSNFTKFFMPLFSHHALILLCWHCDMLSTFSFVDDVMFYGGQRPESSTNLYFGEVYQVLGVCLTTTVFGRVHQNAAPVSSLFLLQTLKRCSLCNISLFC